MNQLSKRDAVYANPDGTYTAELAPGVVRVPDEASATGYRPVDPTLTDTGPAVTPAATDASTTFSDGGDTALATLSTAGGDRLAEGWFTDLPTPQLSGDTATYKDVYPGVDLTLTATTEGFEQSFVLTRRPSAAISLQIPLSLKGLHASIDGDGNLTLLDDAGNVRASADPARIWDSGFDPAAGTGGHQETVPTSVQETPAGPMLVVEPDDSFLQDPATTYPVTVDPSPNLDAQVDEFVSGANPNTNYRTGSFLRTGHDSSYGMTRTYARFFLPNAWGSNQVDIQTAAYSLFETFAPSCTKTEVDLWSNSPGNAIDDSTTWNNKPARSNMYASASYAKGASGCAAGRVSLATGGTTDSSGHMRSLTDLIQRWANFDLGLSTNATDPANGIQLDAADESDATGYKIYDSTNGRTIDQGADYLDVTYNTLPDTPVATQPATGTITNGLPTLSATYSDPDGTPGLVKYWVYDGAGDVMHSDPNDTGPTGEGETVSSGSASPWTAPAGLLQDGATYTWTAQASDGTDDSVATTASRSFTLETTPDTPADAAVEGGTTFYGTTPTFAATYTDGNGDPGYVEFRVMDPTCTSTLQSGDTGTVNNDGVAQWTPGEPMASGSYGLEARAGDATDSLTPYGSCVPFAIQTDTSGTATTLSHGDDNSIDVWQAAADGAIFILPSSQGTDDTVSATRVLPNGGTYNQTDDLELPNGTFGYTITTSTHYRDQPTLSEAVFEQYGFDLSDIESALATGTPTDEPTWVAAIYSSPILTDGTYTDYGVDPSAAAAQATVPINYLGTSALGLDLEDSSRNGSYSLQTTEDPGDAVGVVAVPEGVSYAYYYGDPRTTSDDSHEITIETAAPGEPMYDDIAAAVASTPPTTTPQSAFPAPHALVVGRTTPTFTRSEPNQLTALVQASSTTTNTVGIVVTTNWDPSDAEWQEITDAIEVAQ